MNLSTDQILSLAPDPSSAKAGTKLADARTWQNLGRSSAALWGECQGSALYKVRVDLRDTAVSCSCPSRKFPCKHGLGLMLLAAQMPQAVPQSTPPEWVAAWLDRRQSTQARREEQARAASDPTPADPATAKRRQAQSNKAAAARAAKVARGLDALDLWLNDLIRNGLAGVELKPSRFWEEQAARMVDAQAPGIAARLRAIAAIPNATPDWPDRLLAELGRVALLSEAYRNIDTLDQPLAESVRQLIGWSLTEDEVLARGESVTDEWVVLGERVTVEDRLRAKRTWLLGAETRRAALVLQYATAKAGFGECFVVGTRQRATAVYWPGAYPQRALLRERSGTQRRLEAGLPGAVTVDEFVAGVAQALARQPWLDRFPCVLRGVTPVLGGDRRLVVDRAGAALPLAPGAHWTLLALTGGAPVDLAGEWDGSGLQLFGLAQNGRYRVLPEDRA